MEHLNKTICLFDVDGTLTSPRQRITREMEECLQQIKRKVVVGLVGGSDLAKISEQMSMSDQNVTERYDYVFSENGLIAHKFGKLVSKESIVTYMGEECLQSFINFALKAMSDISLPCKRGTFIEFRSGLINVSPIGRSCSQQERDEFFSYDQKHGIRAELVRLFKEKFGDAGLCFVIGGQISIDVFPVGWDKRFCLQHLEAEGFETIHFFGDKTNPGGNDYEIFADARTIGHVVSTPQDTMQQLQQLFG